MRDRQTHRQSVYVEKMEYTDGKDYSHLKPTGIKGTGCDGCPACGEEENITVTKDADICHTCGYVYT